MRDAPMRHFIATVLCATSLAASLAACSQKDGPDKSDRQERRAERREHGGGGGGGRGGDRAGRFDKLDTDKDGFIEQSEAPARMQQRFTRRDENGDGKISRDEFTSRGRN